MGLLSPIVVIVVGLVAAIWCALERAPFPFALCALAIAVGVWELLATLRHQEVGEGEEG